MGLLPRSLQRRFSGVSAAGGFLQDASGGHAFLADQTTTAAR
jgi:hypothetical protein